MSRHQYLYVVTSQRVDMIEEPIVAARHFKTFQDAVDAAKRTEQPGWFCRIYRTHLRNDWR